MVRHGMRVGQLILAFVVSAAASLLGILILHSGTHGGVEMLDLALTTIEKREWILSALGIGTVSLTLPPFLTLLDPEHPGRAASWFGGQSSLQCGLQKSEGSRVGTSWASSSWQPGRE